MDCSGNGVAISTPECSSRCECSVRWTGNCCETRRPWRNWGDPHLETLDGKISVVLGLFRAFYIKIVIFLLYIRFFCYLSIEIGLNTLY